MAYEARRLVAGAWCVTVASVLVGACSAPAKPLVQPITPAPVDETQALIARLPDDAQRCVVARPVLVPAAARTLIQPLSQASAAAWRMPVDVDVYARIEREGAAGTLEVVELLRFVSSDSQAIRKALGSSDPRPLHWPDEPSPCAATDASCDAVEVRALDGRTFQLRSTLHQRGAHNAGSSCARLYERQPLALEVASWVALPPTGSRVASESTLQLSGQLVTRTLRHRFHDPHSAQLAAERAFTGEEDAPVLGSSLAQRQLLRDGEWLEQRTQVSLEELELATRDREKQRALAPPAAPAPVRSELAEELWRELDETTLALCKRVARQGRSTLPQPVPLPLATLPRLLASWARLPTDREEHDLVVYIVARPLGTTPLSVEAPALRSQACGDDVHVLAASSDDAQLREQGARLARTLTEGEVELLVALRPTGEAAARGAAGLRLRGHVTDGTLALQEVSRSLRAVRWPLLESMLVAPLSMLQGSLFPPDQWSMQTRTPREALQVLAAAQQESAAHCEHEESLVRCKGSFSDARAAERALRRGASAVLLREARQLWSGAK